MTQFTGNFNGNGAGSDNGMSGTATIQGSVTASLSELSDGSITGNYSYSGTSELSNQFGSTGGPAIAGGGTISGSGSKLVFTATSGPLANGTATISGNTISFAAGWQFNDGNLSGSGKASGALTGTILPPIISFDSGSLEISASTGAATFTLSRGPIPIGDKGSTVSIEVLPGTAVEGTDYKLPAVQTVKFDPGQSTSSPITIPIFANAADAQLHINPDFQVVLVNPVNATIGLGTANTTILESGAGNTIVVSAGHKLTISAGQSLSGIVVEKGGSLDVKSGGTAVGPTISAGGSETVESGGTTSNTIVSSGGKLIVSSGGHDDPTTIHSGGSEIVSAGATAAGPLVSGGKLADLGVVNGATVFAGGSATVSSGGTATGVTVDSGGKLIVLNGGSAVDATTQSGGSVTVAAGGSFIVQNGATVTESGVFAESGSLKIGNNATLELAGGGIVKLNGGSIGAAGALELLSGTLSASGTLTNGGTLMAKGGTIDILGVVNGGMAEVDNGNVEIGKSSADNVNVSFTAAGNGGLELAVASAFTGEVSGFGGVNHTNTAQFIDLTAVTSAAGKISSSYTPETGSGTLTITSGGHVVAALDMIGTYTQANFTVGADAKHHVLITDPPATPDAATALLKQSIAGSLVTAAGQGGTSIAPEHHTTGAPLVNPHE